jgi:carboxypeptidase Q
MKKNVLIGLFSLCSLLLFAQASNEDAIFIKSIYDKTLVSGQSYRWEKHLTQQIGNRISGSENYNRAAQWAKATLDTLGLDSVWFQPCMVPHWVRGEKESVKILESASLGTFSLNVLALGGSGASPKKGLLAQVIEVKSLDEVDKLGDKVKGKIVFYNRPMDMTQITTGAAYGGAVDQRVAGPARAAKYGAVGAIVRSMTTLLDDFPHTGTTQFPDGQEVIPALCVSTNHAELLSALLKKETVTLEIKTFCQKLPDVQAYSVIGQIRGSEKPNEFISIGGHLDSWDVGQGAHDDGTGCVQSMEVLYVLKKVGYRPKRTIRCVLFANEENGLAGGKKYAEEAERKGEKHFAAIESDGGGNSPRGFSFEGDESIFTKSFKKAMEWSDLFENYSLILKKGGSGADISPLKKQKTFLIGLNADSQRYFDYHHTNADTFDKVNERELKLGAAAMTALTYLLDKNGLE